MSDNYREKYDTAMQANAILKQHHDQWERRAEYMRKLVKEKLSPQVDALMQMNRMLATAVKTLVDNLENDIITTPKQLAAAKVSMDFGKDRAMEIAHLYERLETNAKELLVRVAKGDLDMTADDLCALFVEKLAGPLREIEETQNKITGMKYKDDVKAAIMREGRPQELFRRLDGGKR